MWASDALSEATSVAVALQNCDALSDRLGGAVLLLLLAAVTVSEPDGDGLGEVSALPEPVRVELAH